MNEAVFSDSNIGEKDTKIFKSTDKILSVHLKNNGTSTALVGWGAPSDLILPGNSKTISSGEYRFVVGELKIDFDTTGGSTNKLYMEVCREGQKIC